LIAASADTAQAVVVKRNTGDYLVKPFALEEIVRANRLIDRLLLLTRSDNRHGLFRCAKEQKAARKVEKPGRIRPVRSSNQVKFRVTSPRQCLR
jgi:DNA-binding response OmpR family regulator